MCFDAKYKGVRFAHLTDEEFKQTKTIVSNSVVQKNGLLSGIHV
jgi:hypothetical protein